MGKRKTFKLPHTLVLIYSLVIGVYFLSLVIPSGQFQRAEKTFQGQSRMVTVPGTYAETPKHRLGPQWLLIAPIRGFQDGSLIIFLIFIFGGTFGILGKTGAIEGGIRKMSAFFSRRPGTQKAVIPALIQALKDNDNDVRRHAAWACS